MVSMAMIKLIQQATDVLPVCMFVYQLGLELDWVGVEEKPCPFFADILYLMALKHALSCIVLLHQESAADILGALLWILQCKSEPLLNMASNVVVKLVCVLPNPLLQSQLLDLVYCLSSLLSSHQVEVATPCATALNLVISNLSATNEKAVIEALKETEISICIVGNLKDFARGVKKIEYFVEMASLLSTVLLRWPSSRFPVCNDVEFMKGLADMHTRTDSSIKLILLKLYTFLGIKILLSHFPLNNKKSIFLLSFIDLLFLVPALCDSVAKKLIENGNVFLQMVVQAMGKSNPHDVRIEGFRLAQCLLVRVNYFL